MSLKKPLRIAAATVAALLLLAALAAGAGLYLADRRMHRQVDVKVPPVVLRTDAAAVERGRYLYASRGCADCHGANGGGRLFLDDGKGLRIKGPNISPAPGSAVAAYQPADWVRTIRHGVAPSGRPLMIMPSEDYNRLTDADLGALVAYVRSLPAAEGSGPIVDLPAPVRVAYGFGILKDAAAKIDHALPPAQPVAEGANAAHGAYVASMCIGCHGASLAGGRIPGGPPDWPEAANLTPGEGSVMRAYPDAQTLKAMFRSGKSPSGQPLQVMPFGSLRELSDVDVEALHLYLKSLAPVKKGTSHM